MIDDQNPGSGWQVECSECGYLPRIGNQRGDGMLYATEDKANEVAAEHVTACGRGLILVNWVTCYRNNTSPRE